MLLQGPSHPLTLLLSQPGLGPAMAEAIYSWKPISRRPTGRPKTLWGDDVRKDIQKIKVPNWKTLAQDRSRWKELVEKAKTV